MHFIFHKEKIIIYSQYLNKEGNSPRRKKKKKRGFIIHSFQIENKIKKQIKLEKSIKITTMAEGNYWEPTVTAFSGLF